MTSEARPHPKALDLAPGLARMKETKSALEGGKVLAAAAPAAGPCPILPYNSLGYWHCVHAKGHEGECSWARNSPKEDTAVEPAKCKACGRSDDPQGISTTTGVCFSCTYSSPEPVKGAKPTTPCPTCQAPCTTEVLMRGGDHGWGTTDKERTVYHYAAPMAPAKVAQWQARFVDGSKYWFNTEGSEDAKGSPRALEVRALYTHAAPMAAEPEVLNTFKIEGESDDAWVDRITGASPAEPVEGAEPATVSCTAADGKTKVYNIPGQPLMVRAVDFNAAISGPTKLAPCFKVRVRGSTEELIVVGVYDSAEGGDCIVYVDPPASASVQAGAVPFGYVRQVDVDEFPRRNSKIASGSPEGDWVIPVYLSARVPRPRP